MEEEIWKPIKDFEGYYEVSNIGRVRSLNYRNTGKEKSIKKYRMQQWIFRGWVNKEWETKTI